MLNLFVCRFSRIFNSCWILLKSHEIPFYINISCLVGYCSNLTKSHFISIFNVLLDIAQISRNPILYQYFMSCWILLKSHNIPFYINISCLVGYCSNLTKSHFISIFHVLLDIAHISRNLILYQYFVSCWILLKSQEIPFFINISCLVGYCSHLTKSCLISIFP